MSVWHISGGEKLNGSVRIQGAKNSVLPILAASIITGCETELTNCPTLTDVGASLEILRHLGCKAEQSGDIISIDSRPLAEDAIPDGLMVKMRSSVIFLGAMLARCGEACLSAPGGCELGPRPIDLHLSALRQMGAEVTESGGELICRCDGLRGARIALDFPSVGATENIMLAACGAQGETVIENAAKEPEIVDLQRYLRAMGVNITGAGSSRIVVSGICPRYSVGHRVMPDRIAAASVLCAAACSGGCVELRSVEPGDVMTVTAALGEMGCRIIRGKNELCIMAPDELRACSPIVTRPYPGFPTDAQPLIMAASLKASGTTIIVENIFDNRFKHCPELRKLGADIRTEGRVAIVNGTRTLRGASMKASDLRGAAALMVAALGSEGVSTVTDEGEFLSRGYSDFPGELRALGASIDRAT